jgi:Protein of unknown function (DUF2958)
MNSAVEQLKTRLPPLLSQEAEDDPTVFARLFLPGTDRNWYVLEGQAENDDFVFFGFVTGLGRDDFAHFYESEVEQVRGPGDETIILDDTFASGKLTDVVPAPGL